MHSIGNEHDAQTILFWVRSHPKEYGRPKCVLSHSAPEGWRYLGNGSFRSVWLSPEGVAYKVNHSDDPWDTQSEEEVNNLGRAWSRGPLEGCRLPKFHHYVVDDEYVVAIEAISGVTLYEYEGPERDELYDLLREIEDTYRLGDMHDENALVDEDGYLVPVDFGG